MTVNAAYQEVQETDAYTSGFALRVTEIVRFRTDKTMNDVDSVEKLEKLYELQYERYPLDAI